MTDPNWRYVILYKHAHICNGNCTSDVAYSAQLESLDNVSSAACSHDSTYCEQMRALIEHRDNAKSRCAIEACRKCQELNMLDFMSSIKFVKQESVTQLLCIPVMTPKRSTKSAQTNLSSSENSAFEQVKKKKQANSPISINQFNKNGNPDSRYKHRGQYKCKLCFALKIRGGNVHLLSTYIFIWFVCAYISNLQSTLTDSILYL